jgi:hypothetical protein
VTTVLQSAGFSEPIGSLLINLNGVAPGQRVARLRSNGELLLLHSTDLPPGTTSIIDWAPPLGDIARYRLLPSSAAAPGQAIDSLDVSIPGGQAYLRRLNDPLICGKVRVTSTGTEGEEVRATVFDISGRRAPLVVFNSRAARRGTITLLTNTRDERNLIEYIVADGSPLLINICSSKAFQPCEMAVGDVRWSRVGTKATQFTCELDYVEVENGDWVGEDSDYLPPAFHALTYADLETLTYQDVFDRYIRYLNVATGTQL